MSDQSANTTRVVKNSSRDAVPARRCNPIVVSLLTMMRCADPCLTTHSTGRVRSEPGARPSRAHARGSVDGRSDQDPVVASGGAARGALSACRLLSLGRGDPNPCEEECTFGRDTNEEIVTKEAKCLAVP